ncbi:MAG: 4-hydroxybenzoate octaprenyltransferase [Flaviaesturariibacter sp.]|nr:4-hydroxybenzoate octaprenyltransferase [Flaviaesturariibacter sp.]
MSTVRSYLSLVKFSHTIFAMPFALIGFFLGVSSLRHHDFPETYVRLPYPGQPGFRTGLAWTDAAMWLPLLPVFLLVIGCMVFARSAAMAFNRYLDRRFDALNPRTAIREIPKGIITPGNALAFTISCCLLFIACTYLINRVCFYLSPVALAVVLGYSYTKRFTPLCHLVLGIGLALAPIGAYLAVTGCFHWLPLLFSGAVICWVSGFDIIYALQDVDFDTSQRLYSIPAAVGKARALRVSEGLHVISAGFVAIAGWRGEFGPLYWGGFAVFAGMLVYQHAIVKPDDLRRVNLAFMTANGIASVVFAVFVIADMMIGKA